MISGHGLTSHMDKSALCQCAAVYTACNKLFICQIFRLFSVCGTKSFNNEACLLLK